MVTHRATTETSSQNAEKPKKKQRKVTTVPQFTSTKKLMEENKRIRSLVSNK